MTVLRTCNSGFAMVPKYRTMVQPPPPLMRETSECTFIGSTPFSTNACTPIHHGILLIFGHPIMMAGMLSANAVNATPIMPIYPLTSPVIQSHFMISS